MNIGCPAPVVCIGCDRVREFIYLCDEGKISHASTVEEEFSRSLEHITCAADNCLAVKIIFEHIGGAKLEKLERGAIRAIIEIVEG